MRTNSIISDPEVTSPVIPALSGQKKAKPTDYERLANGGEYPQVVHYLNERIAHFQRFTPGNEPIEKLSKEQQIDAWGSAVVIIKEFEAFKNTLLAFKKK